MNAIMQTTNYVKHFHFKSIQLLHCLHELLLPLLTHLMADGQDGDKATQCYKRFLCGLHKNLETEYKERIIFMNQRILREIISTRCDPKKFVC